MDTPHIPRAVYTVSELSRDIRLVIEREFSDLWVEGEVSNLRQSAAGHVYFSLKDDRAQIPAVCFRSQARYLRFRPREGEAFRVRGRVGTYEARGEYQILVEVLEPAGRGALQVAFERLREKLDREGLFDVEHKRSLPSYPARVGIVTSPGSAALRDILTVVDRRHGGIGIWIYPTDVQGRSAATELRKGIEYLGSADVDVIILTRGGGSVEDLWPFNDEALARAVFACPKPVVSAVGHETDVVLTDLVADLRAPTPSAAAEIVVRSKREIQDRLDAASVRLVRSMRFRVMELGRQLTLRAGGRSFGIAGQRIRQLAQRVDDYSFRLLHLGRARAFTRDKASRIDRADLAARRRVDALGARARERLLELSGRLDALSPLAVLERGYAVCRKPGGKVVKSAEDVATGDILEVLLYRGRLDVRVRERVAASAGREGNEEDRDRE